MPGFCQLGLFSAPLCYPMTPISNCFKLPEPTISRGWALLAQGDQEGEDGKGVMRDFPQVLGSFRGAVGVWFICLFVFVQNLAI